MKHFTYKLLVVAVILTMTTFMKSTAKPVVTPKMYMFGFVASFNDTIVHFTDVQEVDSVWIESKSDFLLGRELYAQQLRDFMRSNKQLGHRTCIVMYDRNRSKLEKKFIKMRKLYTKSKDGRQHFEVYYLNNGEFKFRSIDMQVESSEAEGEPEPVATKKPKREKGRRGK
jgi:hypothetical protein